MVSTKEAVDAICRHIGFDRRRVRAVATKLTEAGVLPSGGPGKSPELDTLHVVDIVMGAALDVPLRAIAAAVQEYRDLTPGGANLDGTPASIIRNAGSALDIWADVAVHVDVPTDGEFLRRDTIEFVTSWPEISIVSGRTDRFVTSGTLATHWQATGHRRSVTINGAALVETFRSLFGDTHAN